MQYENQSNNLGAPNPQPPLLDRNQKLAVAFLFVFVLGLVGLSIYQFKRNLVTAIDYSHGDSRKILDDAEVASTSEAYLRTQDTDHDGLSDWDEKNIYHTSPYLDDTDGDGIKDGDEVKAGTDPLCPEGKDCSKSNFLTDANASSTAPASTGTDNSKQVFSAEQLQQMNQVSQLLKLQEQLGQGGAVASSAAQILESSNVAAVGATSSIDRTNADQLLKGQADVNALRQSLLKAGMSQADLAKIPDDILMKNYSDILNKK